MNELLTSMVYIEKDTANMIQTLCDKTTKDIPQIVHMAVSAMYDEILNAYGIDEEEESLSHITTATPIPVENAETFFDRLSEANQEVAKLEGSYVKWMKGEGTMPTQERKEQVMGGMMSVLGEIFPGLDGEDHPLREGANEEEES